jgi:hypothetical protein
MSAFLGSPSARINQHNRILSRLQIQSITQSLPNTHLAIRPNVCTTTPVASGSRTISIPLTRVSKAASPPPFPKLRSLKSKSSSCSIRFDLMYVQGIYSKTVSADDLFNQPPEEQKQYAPLSPSQSLATTTKIITTCTLPPTPRLESCLSAAISNDPNP